MEVSGRHKSLRPSNKLTEKELKLSCDPCKIAGDNENAEGYCRNCEECLCGVCLRSHYRSKASRHHTLLDKYALAKRLVKYCEACDRAGDQVESFGFCEECNECLCITCYQSHSRSKSSKNHQLEEIASYTGKKCTSTAAKPNAFEEDITPLENSKEFTFFRDIKVKVLSEEQDCCIQALVFVTSSLLVLCDYNNKCLKLFDTECDLMTDFLVLDASPFGITNVSSNTVAVLLQDCYRIMLVSVTKDTMSIYQTIKTTSLYRFIKFVNEKIFASLWIENEFHILNKTGEILKTIKLKGDDTKEEKGCRAVYFGDDIIYVSPNNGNTLFSIDMEGNYVAVYSKELYEPYCVIPSPQNSLYVCSHQNHAIYEMMTDLSKARLLLNADDGLKYPITMCLDIEKHNMYISSLITPNCNVLKVYRQM